MGDADCIDSIQLIVYRHPSAVVSEWAESSNIVPIQYSPRP